MDWIINALDQWVGFSQPQASKVLQQAGFIEDGFADYCPRCGSSVGLGEVLVLQGQLGCAACRHRRATTCRVIRLGAYRPPLRRWILQIKFRRWEQLARELGGCLGRQVRSRYGQQAGCMVIVPVPMSPLRHMLRGIDHTRVLSKAVAKELGAPVERALRVRCGLPRSPQARLSSTRRRQLPYTRWRLSRRAATVLRNRHVLLVDDVLTTGATLQAAARAIKTASPQSVTAAVLAVSDMGRGARKRQNDPFGEPEARPCRMNQVAHISCLG